jgi:hypothetical protein
LGTKSWSAQISDRLRLEAKISTNKGEVDEIGMQLLGEIDGEWVQLVRYDNAHGECHRHTAHPNGTESGHQFVAILPETFLDQAQRELQKRAEEYLDEYERERSNMKRGVR